MIWNITTGECLQTFEGHKAFVNCLVFSKDEKTLATGSGDNTIKIWDLASRECVQTLSGHSGPVTKFAYSVDGKRITSSSGDNSVKIWALATKECVKKQEFGFYESSQTNGSKGLVTNTNLTDRFHLSIELSGSERAFYCEGSLFDNCLIEKNDEKRDLL